MSQKTWLPLKTEAEASRKWHHLDANGAVLGRLATQIAKLLVGKHKRTYTPSVDCGDFVVVTNSDGVKLTGSKAEQKFYFRHSGYNDGAKMIPFRRQMERDSTKVIHLAVKRMLDSNHLRARRMKRLKVFTGAESTINTGKTVKAAA
ncbi:MAG: 50S ribosomal protein L13 [Elusimicrobia bacterium]|nr:50S ribosomal protein L13 [Elusimicrobiota bacterium]